MIDFLKCLGVAFGTFLAGWWGLNEIRWYLKVRQIRRKNKK